jgi:hypothetical protein
MVGHQIQEANSRIFWKTITTIKARRVTGGAVVTVQRNGYTHCYRVSLRRYNRLQDTLVVHPGAGSSFARSGFEKRLQSVEGLRESRLWAARNANRRAKHWHDATNQGARGIG